MNVFTLLDELRATATTGLNYTRDPYDRERYERLLELAADAYSMAVGLRSEDVMDRFLAEVGYVTTKLGVSAAVFDTDGHPLLARRSDDGLWSLVSGWVDPNETPEAAVVRELREELAVDGHVEELVGVFTRLPSHTNGPHSMVALVCLCSIEPAELSPNHELVEARFAPLDSVDQDGWHPQHRERAVRACEHWRQLRHDAPRL